MLEIAGLNAWYGTSHVLQGVDLAVRRGEVVCLVGRNGAGKTTTLKSVMGLLRRVQGTATFLGQDLLRRPAHARYRMGLAYVPEERRIVPGLSVRENLTLGLLASPHRREEARIVARLAETFPRLAERLGQEATTLSGGEQQMLAIARALAASPVLLMLDEPSEGIMPVLVDEMFALFARLRQEGMTILLVEQNVEIALCIADRAYVLDQGTIAHTADARAMLADEAVKERYCSV